MKVKVLIRRINSHYGELMVDVPDSYCTGPDKGGHWAAGFAEATTMNDPEDSRVAWVDEDEEFEIVASEDIEPIDYEAAAKLFADGWVTCPNAHWTEDPETEEMYCPTCNERMIHTVEELKSSAHSG